MNSKFLDEMVNSFMLAQKSSGKVAVSAFILKISEILNRYAPLSSDHKKAIECIEEIARLCNKELDTLKGG